MHEYGVQDEAQEMPFAMQALMFMRDNRTAIALDVTRIAISLTTDIAVLRLGGLPDPPPFTRWELPMLDVLPPPVGGLIYGAGYHDIEVLGESSMRREVAMTSGHVVEVFEERRDRHLSFPCFQTDARFDGAMSGGPVFYDGSLCGIVCSNMPPPPDEPDVPHASFVATIAPLLTTVVEFGRVGQPERPEFVYDLMRDGIIHTRGLERVVAQRTGDTLTILLPRQNQAESRDP